MVLAPARCCLLQEEAGCEAGTYVTHNMLLPALLYQRVLSSAA